jgi:hypothetical protein
MPLEQALDVVGVLHLVWQALLTERGDDGTPGLPQQIDRPHR